MIAPDEKHDSDLPDTGPAPRAGWLRRWGPAAIVFAVGAALSLAVFGGTRAREREARRAEFERRAAQITRSAQMSFDVPLEVLRSVPALFEASNEVTRSEFRAFVRDALARYPWIYALEWIPRVPGSERAKFEGLAVADGLAGYHFKQDAPQGGLPVRADERPEYFPLFYMEPPNTTALGLEETALETRKVALERARDLGTTAITERLKLVQDPPSVISVIGFHPVYALGDSPGDVESRRKSLRGYAAVVFRVAPVIVTALRGTDLGAVDVALADIEAAESRQLLYESRAGVSSEDGGGEITAEHVATIGGRRWAIRVSDRAGWVRASHTGYTGLFVGLLSSALGAALVYAASAIFRLRREVRAQRRLGQYTLDEKLGEGGMGTVYRAHHALLRRPTAIKLLHSHRGSELAHARFEREVQLMSGLTHPNTAVVYDYGRTPEGVFYYAMEYIEGITLHDLVDADGPQPPERVVHLLRQVCAALAEAHALDLVHRDIKPANVMLCNRGGIADFVKVLDFGLAKQMSNDAGTKLSQSATLLGTPHYMAPESIHGQLQVDARVDIYAVGAMAYFLLTGTQVFSGRTVVEICAKHLSIPPDPLSQRIDMSFPPELEALVMTCLEKEPSERFASAVELEVALAALPVPEWSAAAAKKWWNEHGELVKQRIRSKRDARDPASRSRTLEVDPEGRD